MFYDWYKWLKGEVKTQCIICRNIFYMRRDDKLIPTCSYECAIKAIGELSYIV